MLEIDSYLDPNGCIIDRDIVDTYFDFLDLSKSKLIKNTIFRDGGVVDNGRLLLAADCNLENVIFDNFAAGSFITNTSSNVLKNVKFIGSKLKSIKVRPSALGDHRDGDVGVSNVSFDISSFRGTVDIIGVLPENIVVNPARHLIITAEPFRKISSGNLMEEFQSLIFDMLTILIGNKASYGVFEFSNRDLKNDTFREDLEKLARLGGRVQVEK